MISASFTMQQKTFLQKLQYLQSDLAVAIQSAEVSDLVNYDHYHPRVTLPDALQSITEAIEAWEDYQKEDLGNA